MKELSQSLLKFAFETAPFWSERQDSNLRPDGPKPPARSTAPRPDVFNYTSNDLFLQVVKHVVKPLLLRILRESIVPKKSVFTGAFLQSLQGLSRFCFLARSALLPAGASPPVSCSQTRRATNCATSRKKCKIRNEKTIFSKSVKYYIKLFSFCQVQDTSLYKIFPKQNAPA